MSLLSLRSLASGSHGGAGILSPMGGLVMSGNIFGFRDLGDGDDTSIEWVDTRQPDKYSTTRMTTLHDRKLPGPKHQQCGLRIILET